MEHIIDISNLVKHFGDNAVIDGISLSVSKGEVVVLTANRARTPPIVIKTR